MTIRLKCPCGTILSAQDGSEGQQVRCPKCQTLLQVPGAAPQPIAPAPAPVPTDDSLFDNVPAPQSTPASFAPATRSFQSKSYKQPSKSSNRGLLIGLAAGGIVMSVLVIGGAVAWFAANGGSTSESAEVESSFEALPTSLETGASAGATPSRDESSAPASASQATGPAPTALVVKGRNAKENAMLDLARNFIDLARDNDHQAAVALIDTKLFHRSTVQCKGIV